MGENATDAALFGSPRWGFYQGLVFIPVPRGPLLAENPSRRPPFTVVLPSRQTRLIEEERCDE